MTYQTGRVKTLERSEDNKPMISEALLDPNVLEIHMDFPTLGKVFKKVTGSELIYMKIYRLAEIFEKDIKEFMRNMSLFTMILFPIVMSLVFSNINVGNRDLGLSLEIILMIVGLTYSAIAYSSMAIMIAEENEKDTLRGLVQSPATLLDII